jgi:hypothetical protein
MTLLRRAALARGALMAALLAGFVWGVSYTVLLGFFSESEIFRAPEILPIVTQ